MADYKRELILENVKDSVAAITTAGGFKSNIKLVSRDPEIYDNVNEEDMPAVFVIDTGETAEYFASKVYRVTMTVMLLCYVRRPEGDTSVLSTIVNNAIGDFKKKLFADHSRGGNANQTRYVGSSVLYDLPPPKGIFNVNFNVIYKATMANP